MENNKDFVLEEYLDEVGNILKQKGYSCFVIAGDEKEGKPSNMYIMMKGYQAMLFAGMNNIVNDSRVDERVKDLIYNFSKDIIRNRGNFWWIRIYVSDFLYMLSLLTLCFWLISNLSISYGVNKELLTMIVFVIMAIITSPLFRSKIKKK